MTAEPEGIEPVRIEGSYNLELNDFSCSVCQKIVWKPVMCGNCQKLFCSTCAADKFGESFQPCLNGCETFVGSSCPQLITQQLTRLRIACLNKPHGCNEILDYDALEQHEMECGYQPQQCAGCNSSISKKDLAEHEQNCEMISLTCPNCNMTYIRRDAASHTDYKCLSEQIRQLREDFEAYKQDQTHQNTQTAGTIQQLQQGSRQEADDTIGALRQEFEAFKQQTQEQIKQILQINYQLEENLNNNKQQTDERTNKLEQNVEANKQKPNTQVEQLTKTLDKYKKADIRCYCGGRFCRNCAGCRDWKRDGKNWKRVDNGCRLNPHDSNSGICVCD